MDLAEPGELAFERRRRRLLDDVVRAWDHCDCDDSGRPLTIVDYDRWRALWQGAPAASEELLRVCGGSWAAVLRMSGVAWLPIVATLATPPSDDGAWHEHVVVRDAGGARHYCDGRLVQDVAAREEHLALLSAALKDDPQLEWLAFAGWLDDHGHSAELAATLYLYFSRWIEAVAAATELGAFQEAAAASCSPARSRAICRSREAIDGSSHQPSRLDPRSAA